MEQPQPLKLIECPRDAMQGWKRYIPTAIKINYLNTLLQVGFDTLDFGSFVSPKAIPQLADTKEVLAGLEPGSKTKLLAIVANLKGAAEAVGYEAIRYIGYPFSISPTFQRLNTNSAQEASFRLVGELIDICVKNNKVPVIYLSMGFGNPYGDPYSAELLFDWAAGIAGLGTPVISVADTVGMATPELIYTVTSELVKQLPETEIGVHLHASPALRIEKLGAALRAGCRRFDGAMKGVGGCPMANNELVGNMDTELIIGYFNSLGYQFNLDGQSLRESSRLAGEIFYDHQSASQVTASAH